MTTLYHESQLQPGVQEPTSANGKEQKTAISSPAPAATGSGPKTAVSPNGQKAAGVYVLQPKPLADFLAQDFPPLTFLVDEILAKGHMAVLAGRPKSGKSWLVLQLAQAVDQGRPFLGRSTKTGRVLYVALEDGERRVYQRCKILKWQPKNAAVLFDIARFDGDGVPGPGLEQLKQLAGQYDLIIVDTLIKTLSGKANENDNAQMGMVVNGLAHIAHDTDTAVLLVHHTGKGMAENVFDLLRGASAIRGGYDVGLLLDRKQDEREAVLHMESRDVDLSNMTIQQAANGAGWECLGTGAVITELRAGRDAVKAMLDYGDGVTVDDLAEVMSKGKRAVSSQLVNAEKHGYVYRKTTEPDGKGRPFDLWYLSENLP